MRALHIAAHGHFNEIGKRRPPQGLAVPGSLFGSAASEANTGGSSTQDCRLTDGERLEQLYDSEDDTDTPEPLQEERPGWLSSQTEPRGIPTTAHRGQMRITTLRLKAERWSKKSIS
ncbi:hypothetical protein GN958_ATG04600 [Phytophthora infestans]|uniref:Uncharacterized protein n=1 Tax=Phytophthora infestans TaxID=4787 RepID=A0A8S9UYF2_PHYIN|nr:hypothetical protein GN958_ATG04600 [Phytophthora infestans]